MHMGAFCFLLWRVQHTHAIKVLAGRKIHLRPRIPRGLYIL